MEEKNTRNCRGRANKDQSRWFRFRSSCCGSWDRLATLSEALPALSPAIVVAVCCRKAPLSASHAGISLLSHLCRIPSSMQGAATVHGAAAGCRCNVVSLIPSPISAQLHPPCNGSMVQSSGSSVRECWIQLAAMLSPS